MPDLCEPRGHSSTQALIYSLRENGPAMPLSKHFRLIELACRDGSDEVKVHPALVLLLEAIREACGGRPIHINSGYRTPAHNKAVNGASRSAHLYGMAADIVVRGVPVREVYEVCARMDPGGLGKYHSWVHVDVLGVGRRWEGP